MTRLNIPLFVALAALLLSAVPANARDTLPHQRMIRKRSPSIGGPGPIGAAAVIGLHVRQVSIDPTGSASQSSTSAAAASTTAAATSSASSSSVAVASTTSVPTSSAAATTSTSSSSSAAATTTSGGLLNSLTAILGSSTSSTSSTVSTTSAAPTTSSSSSSSSSAAAAPTTTSPSSSANQAPQTTEQPAAQTPTLNIATSSPAAATSHSQSVSVNYIYSTQAAAAASASAEAAKKKTEKITKNTIISLVVIASCIGGAVAIWTVIRKWKLSPSEKFDDRMQPIDWAPPPANGTPDDAIEEKTKHRRAGSGASHGSFTSGGVGQSEQGHGVKGGMYADSQYSHGYATQPQDFPPPHDFTAGTAQPGGYGQYYAGQQYAGGPGYADLQRGPSMSESNYSNGANVSRGLSYSRGHGAYDSQSGAIPPMPNPYGGEYGYDDFNHPPAGQQPQVQGQAQAPYRAL
ncbi:unnamed protein product [Rhizoctonia solani]|uniref:Uncharacterized protein n=1 Tax=Rhizoctonia solani TaxID=456999 RepID=A0A8H2X3D6_9AGAM|nr:unnamed protein product [Rhizoctonia solani]